MRAAASVVGMQMVMVIGLGRTLFEGNKKFLETKKQLCYSSCCSLFPEMMPSTISVMHRHLPAWCLGWEVFAQPCSVLFVGWRAGHQELGLLTLWALWAELEPCVWGLGEVLWHPVSFCFRQIGGACGWCFVLLTVLFCGKVLFLF